MPRIQLILGNQAAPIAKPNILIDNNLVFESPVIASTPVNIIRPGLPVPHEVKFGYEEVPIHGNIGDAGLELVCKIEPDLLPLLRSISYPQFNNTTYELGLEASTLTALAPLIVESSTFPLKVSQHTETLPLVKPTVSADLVSILELVRVFGMNYQSRIWREIKLRDDEPSQYKKQSTRPFTKSYIEPEQQFVANRPKPKAPSFWDLAYALLQPPLVLEEVESLFLPHDLYPFQKTGIHFLMGNESALLADEMGTGKTVQTVVAIRLLIQKARIRHALIVCPVAVLRQWDEHMRDWAPELLVTVVRGNQRIRTTDWAMPAHVYITGYDTLRQDIDKGVLLRENLSKFDIVVLDEAQYIKNATSGRAKAIKQLTTRQRWALTGTPVENKIDDLVSLFEFLRPGYLTPFDLYPARIRERISPYFLRRRKEDVLKDLPPKVSQEYWLELDTDQRKAYEMTLHRVQTELGELGERVRKFDIFRVLTQLKQICNFAPGKSHSPKLELLLEQIEAIVESERKVIVFSQYISEGIEKLENALKPYGLAKVVGGQSDRDYQVKRFQEAQDIPILAASVRAGGVGLNLQVASYVVHFDHWWNPAVMWQAEARAHRQGQKQQVNVYSYWMLDTIEERIYQTLKSKGLLFADIVDGLSETELDDVISTEEWLDMLGVKYKQKPSMPKQAPLGLTLSEIQEKLFTMTPSEFEHLVEELLRCFGYPNTRVTGHSHDGGIDVISTRNTPDGMRRVIAQCKRYRGAVGIEIAREFFGVIASDTSIEKGFLVTTGEITRECFAFCERSGVIVPINGVQVSNYVRQFGIEF